MVNSPQRRPTIIQLNYGMYHLETVYTHSKDILAGYVDVSNNLSSLKNKVLSCCFSSDGKLLASSSIDGTIILWNVESRKSVKTMNDNSYVSCVMISYILFLLRFYAVHFHQMMNSLFLVEMIVL